MNFKLSLALASAASFLASLPARVHSVDSVMSTFTKTVDRLDKVAESHTARAESKTNKGLALLDAASSHEEEVIRARDAAYKLRQLLS